MRSICVIAGAVLGALVSVPAQAAPAGGATASTWDIPLNIRSAPDSGARRLGTIANGGPVPAECQVTGQWVSGKVRNSNKWDRLPSGGYVSDAYVSRPGALPDCSSLPAAGARPAPGGFIGSAVEPARSSRATYGVPVSVTIAQAILESGWGGSDLARKDHNLFGIKCFGWPGPIAVKCASYRTSECKGTRCYRTTAQFRSYRSEADSFADHGRFLRVNDRYAGAFRHTGNPDEFARAIARAGYATDPQYAQKIVNVMKANNLYQYDV
ncbi:sporangiospore maturation cell wall hydrolase GsmA [Longispora albida]|uniref:sporangiospore maturation cell wall hydrolase GsmA n=1 Tax=Longispora albida TaxID=203523 RepID=UPI000366608B|nr:sporangiospore maturation cell wall hydrolase GsmA [Longispora albida]